MSANSSGTVYIADQVSGSVRLLTPSTAAPLNTLGLHLQTGTLNATYSTATPAATGGTGSYTWSTASGALPPGLTLNSSSGQISGAPTTAGIFDFTVTLTDSGTPAQTVSANDSIVIAGPVSILTTSLPPGALNAVYPPTQLIAQGGDGVYSWSTTSPLPTGMTLSSAGLLSGTPTATGTFNLAVNLGDSNVNASKTVNLTLGIGTPLTPAPSPLSGAVVSSAYSSSLISGGVAPYTCALASGSLPAGLMLNATTCAIAGTPTAGGSFSFSVAASDSEIPVRMASQAYALTVTTPLAPTKSAFSGAVLGNTYSVALLSGGTSPYACTITAGALPTGLTLKSSTCSLSGTVNSTGTYSVTVGMSDSSSPVQTATQTFTFNIPSALTLTSTTSTGALVGSAFTRTLASGGTTPYSCSVATGGTLPAGLSLNGTTCVLSGTPGAAGTFNFSISAADGETPPQTAVQAYAMTVASAVTVTSTSLVSGTSGVAGYAATLTAGGGYPPYSSWTIASGALPGGLALSASLGTITGTPTTTVGSPFSFTVTTQDSLGNVSAVKSLSIAIAAPTVTITTSSLPGGSVGTAYSQTPTATGGVSATYTWLVASGALPGGLALNSATGAITGTPNTAVGSPFAFTLTATDTASNVSAAKSLSIAIAAPTVTITTSSLPGGSAGTAYSQTPTATGGVSATYTWSVASGALPGGLALNSATGAITGTPNTAVGSPFAFTLTAADTASNVSAAKGLSIAIAASTAPVTVTLTSSLGTAHFGQQVTLTAAVTPAAATGEVMFYDGVNILGSAAVSSGQAVLRTIGLAAGSHALTAYFNGNPSYGVSASAPSVAQTVSATAGTGFSTATLFSDPAGAAPYTVMVGDFNGDGKADIAANGAVALGKGDGTFSAFVTAYSGSAPVLATGDFNGDGIADLATSLGIAPGKGDGTFLALIPYPGGSVGNVAAVGDFNGDGKADLATAGGILLGNGDGTFQSLRSYPGASGSLVVVGDFNGDGKADAAVAPVLLKGGASVGTVFLGNGDGTFGAGVNFGTNITGASMVTADFNGDGKADLALDGGSFVFLGNGDGTFRQAAVSGAASGSAMAVGDFNGDGKTDLAVITSAGSNAVNVIPGNGDGTFGTPVLWNAGTSPQMLAVADFNGDNRADLVLSLPSGNVSVLPGASTVPPQVTTTSLAAGTAGAAYSATLTASGGTIPYSNWTVAGGSLPSGLTLNAATGIIAGTPAVNSTSLFVVTVQDHAGLTSPEQALSIITNPAVTTGGGGGGPVFGGSSLTASATGLTFTALPGMVPAPQTVTLADSVGSSSYSTSESNAWLSVSPASGPLSAGQGSLNVSVNPAGLGQGTYTGTINVVSDKGGLATISVTFNVQAQLTASPGSLAFTYRLGDTAPPTPQDLSIFSNATFSNAAGISFTTGISTVSGGNWLVAGSGGTAPANVYVNVNTANLSAGVYTGTVNTASATAAPLSVPVTLTVLKAAAPKLSTQAQSPAFALTQNSAAASGQIAVSNIGGGTLKFTAQASAGQSWLVLTSTTSSATASMPGAIGFTASPAGLMPGLYNAQITVSDSASSDQSIVNVSLAVTASSQSIVLSQTGLSFGAVAGGPKPPSQTFTILIAGTGTLSWAARAGVVGSGTWLSVSPASGSASATAGSSVSVSVDATGLQPGQYYGSIHVTAANVTATGAANSPQSVSVVLNVGTQGTAAGVTPATGGLLFTGAAGSAVPAQQQVTLFNPSASPLTYSAAAYSASGLTWLSITPATGTLIPGTNSVTIQTSFSGLTAGVQSGSINFAFSDGSTGSVQVLALAMSTAHISTACTGGKASYLLGAIRQPAGGLTLQAGAPQPVRAQIVDDCGNPLSASNGGSAQATFSDSEAPVSLNDIGGGIWEGTWTPSIAGSGTTLQIGAMEPDAALLQSGSAIVKVVAASATSAGIVTGVVNAAASGQGTPQIVSPGSYIAIYGAGLAGNGAPLATSIPLPTTWKGTQLLLGGQPLPLSYAGPTQVNAVVPQGLNPSTAYPLVVLRGTTESTPVSLTTAALQPAIFTQDLSGSNQGVVAIAGTSILAAPAGANSRPAVRGSEYIAIYCTGLGPVQGPNGEPMPADGAAAPSSVVLSTKAMVTATIGGVTVPVTFAGLTPTLVQLYQVNLQIPAGAPAGSSVPLTITVTDPVTGATVQSNVVTIALQ